MFRDPIVEGVRKIRKDIEAECQNDAQKYFEHIQQLQKNYNDRLVSRKPKTALTLVKTA